MKAILVIQSKAVKKMDFESHLNSWSLFRMDRKSIRNSLPEKGREGENGKRNGKVSIFFALESFHLEYFYSQKSISRCGTQSVLIFP